MLGKHEWAEENLHYLNDQKEKKLIECSLLYFKQGPKRALEELCSQQKEHPANKAMRAGYFIFDRALLDHQTKGLLPYFDRFERTPFMDALHILFCLKEDQLKEAEQLLESYPSEILHNEYSPLFIPMGCYLLCTETEEIALSHFAGSIEIPYPPTSMLLGNYLLHKIHEESSWMQTKALFWEKVTLWRHLELYYDCIRRPQETASCFEKSHGLLNQL
jgi:hypothetical protein